MTNSILCVFALSLLLTGCATKLNSNVNYYLLSDLTSLSAPKDLAERSTTIAVQTIELADYLKQASLSMQIEDHQLYYSKQDFWAQPLQTSMQSLLIHDLNNNAQSSYFVDPQLIHVMKPDLTLGIKISHFMPTYQSTVVLAGQYWIYNKQSQMNLAASMHNFKYELPLTENGYSHAVGKLRRLLENLSKDIVMNMENIENL